MLITTSNAKLEICSRQRRRRRRRATLNLSLKRERRSGELSLHGWAWLACSLLCVAVVVSASCVSCCCWLSLIAKWGQRVGYVTHVTCVKWQTYETKHEHLPALLLSSGAGSEHSKTINDEPAWASPNPPCPPAVHRGTSHHHRTTHHTHLHQVWRRLVWQLTFCRQISSSRSSHRSSNSNYSSSSRNNSNREATSSVLHLRERRVMTQQSKPSN